MFGLNEEEKFKDVHKLEIICPACMAPSPIASLVVTDATGAMKSGLACQACSVKFSVPVVYCQALGLIRKCLAAYHQYWLECDEPACKAQTQRMRVYESRCVNDQCRGSMYPKVSSFHCVISFVQFFGRSLVNKYTTNYCISNRCLILTRPVPKLVSLQITRDQVQL